MMLFHLNEKYRLIKNIAITTFIVVTIVIAYIFMFIHGKQPKKMIEVKHATVHQSFDLAIPFSSNASCPKGGVIKKHAEDINGDGLPQKEEWQQGKEEIICNQS